VNGEQVRIAVVRDVTDKRRREAELTEQAEVLRILSVRDELTGLYNRRGFLELARQRLRLISPEKKGACLFFADLNGMKAINDGLGHEVGNRALSATAKLLSNVFRESDVVARLGGDEFAALAGECEAAGLTGLQARLQTAIETFNATGLEPFRLSVSIGAALFDPRQPLEFEALMEVADANMYEAKRARARADGLAEGSLRTAEPGSLAASGRS
jgi:diguanylate cyclase (GGDEF)-like protein